MSMATTMTEATTQLVGVSTAAPFTTSYMPTAILFDTMPLSLSTTTIAAAAVNSAMSSLVQAYSFPTIATASDYAAPPYMAPTTTAPVYGAPSVVVETAIPTGVSLAPGSGGEVVTTIPAAPSVTYYTSNGQLVPTTVAGNTVSPQFGPTGFVTSAAAQHSSGSGSGSPSPSGYTPGNSASSIVKTNSLLLFGLAMTVFLF